MKAIFLHRIHRNPPSFCRSLNRLPNRDYNAVCYDFQTEQA